MRSGLPGLGEDDCATGSRFLHGSGRVYRVRKGLSQTFLDRYANCARPQHSLTFGCGFGFHPVKFLFQVETTWARQSAITPKTAREKTLRQAPVERLADALLAHRHLDGAAIAAILG